MPLRFLLVLFSYLILAGACLRANSLGAAGFINTMTLGLLLFTGLKARHERGQRPFWTGFFLFYLGLQTLYFLGSGSSLFGITLADAAGYRLRGQGGVTGPIVPAAQWYGFIAHSFIATVFGVVGGALATMTMRRK